MRSLTSILLFVAMYFILSGYYEEKIETIKAKKKTKPEYVPAPRLARSSVVAPFDHSYV